MSERLWDRHEQRVHEGALAYLEQKRALREYAGFGGIKLTETEEREIYQEVKANPAKRLSVLQNRQRAHKQAPWQIPKDLIKWIQKMEATGTTESPQPESLAP